MLKSETKIFLNGALVSQPVNLLHFIILSYCRTKANRLTEELADKETVLQATKQVNKTLAKKISELQETIEKLRAPAQSQ